MTCPRCAGLMMLDDWRTADGLSGVDWHCITCSHSLPITWRQDYDPLRPVTPRGVPEADEFVLTRAGELYHRGTRT